MLRRCYICGAYLSRYNDDDSCFPCQKKKQEAIDDRLFLRAKRYAVLNTYTALRIRESGENTGGLKFLNKRKETNLSKHVETVKY